MKSYTIFRPLFGIVIALAAACFTHVAVASASDRDFYGGRSFEAQAMCQSIAYDIWREAAPVVAVQDDRRDHLHSGSELVASCAAPTLAPEYAESLLADALNFLETRLRC